MSKNWAIAIGINQYNPNNYTPLKYAKRDAALMRDFFRDEAQFDEVYYFADDSPPLELKTGAVVPTSPTRGHLRSFLQDRFETPFLKTGDNCWFFFAGHGERYRDQDYLIPIDANPRDMPESGLLVSYVRDRLSRCGADNVILILDACRSEGGRSHGGVGYEEQQGVITISACSPAEKSWEIEALQQGVFTYALLEAFRLPGERSCATVERLNNYLRHRVPELCQQYQKAPAQLPRISADPSEKHHFILLPRYARDADIAVLKTNAYRAAFEQKWDLAEQLCIRAIAASSGRDMDLLEMFAEIKRRRQNNPPPSPPPAPTPTPSTTGDRSTSQIVRPVPPTPPAPAKPQSFTITLSKGLFAKTITLEMIAIPGGKFWMGSPDGVERDSERSRHKVAIAPFFMSKTPITQTQYQALMGKNPSHFKGDNRPVETVSWHEAIAFCEQLSKKSDRWFGLPSEAQWEYACRAGTKTKFYFGDNILTDQVNHAFSKNEPSDVAIFPPNKFGLYDMHGNVWEWCADHWHSNYDGAPSNGTAWLTNDQNAKRVLRGGSWGNVPGYCRSACRVCRSPGSQCYDVGFRVACS